jgi:hypothetical protein
MQPFVTGIAAELERPRLLPSQAADHIASHYDVPRDELGAFLVERLPRVEEYEADLILSPVFTPSLEDQARLSDLLDRETLEVDAWPELIRVLAERPTVAHLRTEDGVTHAVRLPEVVIERFVTRLGMERSLPERFQRLLNTLPPEGDRPMLKAIARRAVWSSEARADILFRFLVVTTSGEGCCVAEVVQLLQLVETYQPGDVAEFLARIPAWQEVLKREISVASSPKPFFSERIQELHGGGRDQRTGNNTFIAAKKRALAFLSKLQTVLTPEANSTQ